ncbi:hypothetical protein ACQRBN_13415 [Bariatricus sp. SGI.154]|uniref:hypothetical protein n=1 Tax=Bariatricus sp. SGI.154 TaxID=3420549 RepID=UPI003D024480
MMNCYSKMMNYRFVNDLDEEQLLRRQQQAVGDLREALDGEETDKDRLDTLLWNTLILFQGYPFYTAKNLEFFYYLKGNEMFVSRKDKSITKASIIMAFHKALELGRVVIGPKKLGTFGASYMYPIFIRIGVIEAGAMENGQLKLF